MNGYFIVFVFSLIFALCSASNITRPHIIFVLADDLGWDDVGFHGSKDVPTPNLDAMAYSGVILSNYYVQPICTPTRSALLTGRLPIHLGMQHGVVGSTTPYGLPLEEKLLPQYLKELGYSTHLVGKWHIGHHKTIYLPTFRGFDTHFGPLLGFQDYWDHTHSDLFWGLDFRRNTEPVLDLTGNYSTNLFSSEAERLILNHNVSKPMYLQLSFTAPHTANEWNRLEPMKEHYQKLSHIQNKSRREYAAMVMALDEGFARVVKALHLQDMLKDSVIVFSSDNGAAPNGGGSNLPLRGQKGNVWEGGVRAAGFVWSTYLENKQYINNKMIHVSDWLPTFLDLADCDDESVPNTIYGVDQWPVIRNNAKEIRQEILHNIDPVDDSWALRDGDLKLIYGSFNSSEYANSKHYLPVSGTIDVTQEYFCDPIAERFKSDLSRLLKEYNSDGTNEISTQNRPLCINCKDVKDNVLSTCLYQNMPCLFDISKDPCELNNIALNHPNVVKKMLDKINHYKRESRPVRNQPRDPKANPDFHGGIWGPWLD